jgi:hypothetical protein
VDERLLVTCTRKLLEGWTGPVHGLVHNGVPVRAVSIGDFSGDGRAMLWTDVGDWLMFPGDLSLDLSRAECRDRVLRAAVQRVANDGAPRPYLQCPTFSCCGPAWILDTDSSSHTTPFKWYDSADLQIDPNDNTRLPDGSRLVDALALAAVWREVSR